jgi:Ser/Thr protein kinase RdoA (MazF antagonist)
MESKRDSERDTYRTIVFGPDGNTLLLKPVSDGFVLPSVEIPRWQRTAEHITAAIQQQLNQKVICLFNPPASASGTAAHDQKYQVMECLKPSQQLPDAEWVPVSSLREKMFHDLADQQAVRRCLPALHPQVGTADTTEPFARLGWFRELQTWIEEVIGSLGLSLTGKFSQLNASSSFSLIRFETTGGAVWFKAVGEPNVREFSITTTLSKLFSAYLPRMLATRPEWNGWLSLEVKGINLAETLDTQLWKAAAAGLAKLQVESVGNLLTPIHSGVRDLGASALSHLSRPFFDAMVPLMENQIQCPPASLGRNEVVWLGEQIEDAVASTSKLEVPEALGHLDLNPGNVIVSEGQCVFLDWAEAYVGNPLFSLRYLIDHLRRIAGMDAAAEACLISAYEYEWSSLVSPEKLHEASAFAPLIAVFAYAAANDAWTDQARLQDPKVAGYLRSLTRRMHREAKQLTERSALCPN